MIVVTALSAARLRCDVTRRYSDSGVVTRKFGGRLIIAARIDAGRVAGAHLGAERGQRHSHLRADLGDLAQRSLEVLVDVDRERLQRRHVDDLRDALDRLAALRGAIQRVDADEEAGERLARTRSAPR